MMRSKKRRSLRAAAALDARLRLPVSLRADAGEEGAAKWQMLFPKGVFHRSDFPGGQLKVDDAFAASLVANWKKRGSPELPIDYFHRGGSDVAVPNSEKVAAGWITDVEARNDGTWGLVKWTAKARTQILADELRYLSPEWQMDGRDVATGQPQGPTLLAAGLLNDPFFQEMPRVAASDVVDPPAPPQPAVQEYAMNREQLNAMLKEAGITLAASATDAEAHAALSKHISATVKAGVDASDALKAKATAAANEEALKAQLAAKNDETATLKASLETVTKNVSALQAKEFTAGVDALQKRLVTEGRITAAAQANVKTYAEKQGLEEAVKFYDTFPKGGAVPVGPELGIGEGGEPDDRKAVKASAAAKQKEGLTGSAAIRAAALENAGTLKELGTLGTLKN